MEVKLDKNYPLDVDAARAWAVLRDVQAVAACMPGASITEKISDTSYKGAVKVKVGPAVAQFGGTVDVLGLDEAAQKTILRGKGADKGGSSASMDLTATIESDPTDAAKSILHGEAAVIVNGKFAQFGGRMMVQVSDMILAQFVENFAKAAAALPSTSAVASSSQSDPAPAEAINTSLTSDTPRQDIQATSAAPVAGEINGLAIVWALIKSWFSGLFGKR